MEYKYRDSRIVIFAKAPIKGQVKTRLASSLTAEQALELHCALVAYQLKKIRSYQIAPIELWVSGNPDDPLFTSLCAAEEIYQQQGRNLGQRMSNAVNSALTRGNRVVIVGTDCTGIDAEYLCQALGSLENARDVVLGPAEDGGYVLIGLAKQQETLFRDIAWGEASVLQETVDKINALGLCYELLDTRWDIDRPEDLARLADVPLGISYF